MPRRFTLDALRTSCKQQVDLENHAVISDAEWAGLISRAYGELYTIVFEAGLSYFEYTVTLTTTGTNVLDEIEDHLSTVAMTAVDSSGSRRDLRELMAQERSRYSGLTGPARFFALVDDKIYLYPTPATGEVYEMRYVPQSPDLSVYDSAANVDVVTPDGHNFLINAVAVMACAKTEADPSAFIRERDRSRQLFMESVQLRALNAPRRRIIDYGDEIESGFERDRW